MKETERSLPTPQRNASPRDVMVLPPPPPRVVQVACSDARIANLFCQGVCFAGLTPHMQCCFNGETLPRRAVCIQTKESTRAGLLHLARGDV